MNFDASCGLKLVALIGLLLGAGAPLARCGTDSELGFGPEFRAVLFDVGNTLVTRNRSWVPGAKEALERMRSAGIPIGLLSNTGDLTRGVLRVRHLPVDFRFRDFQPELINLSSELGFQKPDIRVFEAAARRAYLKPEEILFVDENLLQVLAAQRAGFRAISVMTRVENGVVVESDIAEVIDELIRMKTKSPGPTPAVPVVPAKP